MSGFIDDSWILISASFSLLQNVNLVEIYMKKILLHTDSQMEKENVSS